MSAEVGEIVITGVCAAGKSTLARRLQQDSHRARAVAQEHSCIPDLWRWSGASTMVYLHASFQAVKRRRRSLMHRLNYEAQLDRLRSARAGATVYVDTSDLSPDQVYALVKSQLSRGAEDVADAPIPDEPGSDAPSRRPAEPVPVAEEPDQKPRDSGLRGLPIPEEL